MVIGELTSEFNVVDYLVQGLGRTFPGTEVGLLLVHGSNVGQLP